MQSKTSDVIKHLEEHGHITSMEAFKRYGATRLSAIIFNLRHNKGFNIDTIDMETTDRYGKQIHFAKYVLRK